MKKKKKTTKKTARKTTTKSASKAGTMSLPKLLTELSRALTEPLGSDERRVISMRISNAKQRTAKRKARR